MKVPTNKNNKVPNVRLVLKFILKLRKSEEFAVISFENFNPILFLVNKAWNFCVDTGLKKFKIHKVTFVFSQ